MLVLAAGGPQPRVPAGGWEGAELDYVCRGLITDTVEDAEEPIWADGIYPFRVYYEVLTEDRDVALEDEASEALRRSANQRGRPVVLSASLGALLPAGESTSTALEIDGALDRLGTANHCLVVAPG